MSDRHSGHVAAQNARLVDFTLALRRGTKTIGQVVCAASPAVAAAYVAFGVDWVWIEWQHSCQDATAFRAQVAAVAQRGGLSVARTAGAHDKTGIQQCLDAGVDIVLVPYINSVEEAKDSIRHCLFAPRGDRVWNGSELSRSKKSAVMFQLETSACIDALEEICQQPEMDFGFVGPGDLAMSMGLVTRDSMLGYLKAGDRRRGRCLRRLQRDPRRTRGDSLRGCSAFAATADGIRRRACRRAAEPRDQRCRRSPRGWPQPAGPCPRTRSVRVRGPAPDIAGGPPTRCDSVRGD